MNSLNGFFICPRRKLSKLTGIPASTVYDRLKRLERENKIDVWRNGRKALIFKNKKGE